MRFAATILRAIGLTTTFLMLSSAAAFAGTSILPGKLGDYGKHYDASTLESFSGRILGIYEVRYSKKSKLCCYALRLERDDGEGEEIVYLGSKSRLDKKGFSFKNGDTICIVGSRSTIEGNDIIIAQQLNYGAYVLALRTKTGRHFAPDTLETHGMNRDSCLVAYYKD